MPRNTSVWLPLQSRRRLVHKNRVLSLTVDVLHFDAVTPTCHCKEIGVLDLPSEAVFPRLTDSCMERMHSPRVRQRDPVGKDKCWEAGGMWLGLFPHL